MAPYEYMNGPYRRPPSEIVSTFRVIGRHDDGSPRTATFELDGLYKRTGWMLFPSVDRHRPSITEMLDNAHNAWRRMEEFEPCSR